MRARERVSPAREERKALSGLYDIEKWYQNELPKKIKSRGKDAHLNHEELVQTMKWKQIRGKFYPQLSYLVKVNTPRAVMAETKKAFKKLPNLEQAITALSNLKGVGTTMASALLAAASPENAPFMADECLMAIPEIEGIDYTTKEYLNFVQHIQNTVERLNKQNTNGNSWSPHRVELALWTHYVASELKPELLDGIPEGVATENGNSHPASNGESAQEPASDDSNQEPLLSGGLVAVSNNSSGAVASATSFPTSNNGNATAPVGAITQTVANGKAPTAPTAALDDNSTTTSFTEDSLDKPSTPAGAVTAPPCCDDTNDSLPTNEDSSSNATPRPTDESEAATEEDSSQDSVHEPPSKKSKK
ncbi:PREDICTED: uncharacterized protein LOC105362082 isoform X2 [Ceratosolen solmsi marchali]|uniref:Uncharacterized protein LOC105362082 isoform X2 n=1 Tax=Ceratosolen solmsi marchali TaxID=326594 RepID=A0AAJ7DVA7_9HYME|nr:PREDICTED: uncharacterized protein LOC105362082 isoform X2 [Ceratosolen solmsi marchali]